MKNSLKYLLCAVVLLSSCDSFLDKVPDSRTELNSADKVTKLLVSAYPSFTSILMAEMASDNAMDNGSKYEVSDKLQEEAYLWDKLTAQSNDSPSNLWQGCYASVAVANQALQAIDAMGNSANLQPQRGEALMCRAWAHFQLALIFCKTYNPETASQDLGLPYSSAPETTVKPNYKRGSLAQLYQNIQKDIEEALPLIDNNLYSVPKYHFNRKAAYAFAARFYLYTQQWEACIEAATEVLGSNPTSLLRNWNTIHNMARDYESRCNAYIAESSAANLLIQTAYSDMPFWLGATAYGARYGHNNVNIAQKETYFMDGIWGNLDEGTGLYMGHSTWGLEQKVCYSKYSMYAEYTDKVAGTGYRRSVTVMLSTNETLLCRAEAYAHLKDYDHSIQDINYWIQTNTLDGKTITANSIDNIYGDMKYMEATDGTPLPANENGTPKKRFHPVGFTVEDGRQENFLQCILHLRRCETMMDGLRWFDIKRFGIEIAHNRDGMKADILHQDDPRRVFQIPDDVISAGIEPNPR
ncbi:MAG: RagB/SusD family nutrient uptake outer membrane protein [Bacteroidetes bacterium]|nr:RagB/SusD family nutrient uptake outer membrane protein [Bacteroidota bacterium]MBP1677682.1 RagB/SusD family nutrient uptake outer membrane protein [Bacteroidota bacterium]